MSMGRVQNVRLQKKRINKTILLHVNFRLLYMLAFQPKFIRALWFILPTKATHSGFSTPLNLIAKGIQIRKLLNHTVHTVESNIE